MMSDNTILPADHALLFSSCLLDALDRMPALTEDDRAVLLRAAKVMAEHGCNSVIADAVLEQSMAQFGVPKTS
jgi:hypothetical protein